MRDRRARAEQLGFHPNCIFVQAGVQDRMPLDTAWINASPEAKCSDAVVGRPLEFELGFERYSLEGELYRQLNPARSSAAEKRIPNSHIACSCQSVGSDSPAGERIDAVYSRIGDEARQFRI